MYLKRVYIFKKSIGPNTDPCGTPLKTDFQFEISPSTITSCILCVSLFSIQLITSLHIPWVLADRFRGSLTESEVVLFCMRDTQFYSVHVTGD